MSFSAVALQEPRVAEQRAAAWREVMRSTFAPMAALLVKHAADVCEARKSRMVVLDFMATVEADSPAGRAGCSDMSFTALGDPKCHDSRVSRWLSELVEGGVLTGSEPFLEGVPLIARGPDGKTAVDRPTALPLYMQPPPAPVKQNAIGAAVSAVGAAVAGAARAVVGAVAGGRGRPGDDALPPEPPATEHRAPTPPTGPTKRIKLLRDCTTGAAEFSAGTITKWDAADAGRLVARVRGVGPRNAADERAAGGRPRGRRGDFGDLTAAPAADITDRPPAVL